MLSNALKFTPEGGAVQITAVYAPGGLSKSDPVKNEDGKLACMHPRAGSVRVIVKDTGAGLTPEQLALLFSEGVQFDANKLQAGGGSGLGLFITKGLVQQHGGTIEATSEGPGLGAAFTVELPLYEFPPGVEDDSGGFTNSEAASEATGGSGDQYMKKHMILCVN